MHKLPDQGVLQYVSVRCIVLVTFYGMFLIITYFSSPYFSGSRFVVIFIGDTFLKYTAMAYYIYINSTPSMKPTLTR